MVLCVLIGSILICFDAYSHSNAQSASVQNTNPEHANTGARVAAARLPNVPPGDNDAIKVDLRKYYEEGLKKLGVSDFSAGNLVRILDGNEISTKKMYAAWLLGEMNEVTTIPTLEKALGDESDYVKVAASQALLKMGNKKAIPVLEKMCVDYSKEYKAGNRKNLSHLQRAAAVLADAGEVSAIPYLRHIAADQNSWGCRITALRALSKLAGKDPNVIADISRMKNDENPQVREEAAAFVKKFEAKK